MTNDNTQSVLIVEDHNDAAKVLSRVVEQTFPNASIQIFSNFKTSMEHLTQHRHDVALIDIGLPDGNGVDLIKYINEQNHSTLCIVTTIFDDEEHLFDALQSGAAGYLLKGYSAEELQVYLKEAISGRPALSPRIAQLMLGYFRQTHRIETREGTSTYTQKQTNVPLGKQSESELSDLTEREREVLTFISKGCQVKEVSRLLGISANTVKHHIKSLYDKLNVHNRAEATAAAVQLNIYKPT